MKRLGGVIVSPHFYVVGEAGCCFHNLSRNFYRASPGDISIHLEAMIEQPGYLVLHSTVHHLEESRR